ncbi:MAG: 3-dehydroquinate synthase [Coriobacteriia bacterium]|nr:3-dehydroquinate synthase [Coriobacteriia bacterium]
MQIVTGGGLRVSSSTGSYPVRIGSGVLRDIGSSVAGCGVRSVAIITDTTVKGLYADEAVASLREAGVSVVVLEVPPGETAKSWSRAGELLQEMSGLALNRDDAVIALGGGVIGDLAGFCAAVYMRGIGVFQVPTTLLAQVDSSIGGKTGLDLPRGKNLVGSFWPPLGVLTDTGCLATLGPGEWRSGMAEVAKSAILDGVPSLEGLERDAAALGERAAGAVERAVVMAAGFKARVVSHDEREAGMREALNYGHTLGHAIERVAGYGAVAHGIAVAEGMRFAARLAERIGVGDPAWSVRQDHLLDSLGLTRTGCPYDAAALLSAMRSDKKVRAGEIRFVLSTGPGLWEARPIGDAELTATLSEWSA